MDTGGPRREFFRLFPQHAAASLFCGETLKFFTVNVPAYQVEYANEMIVISIPDGNCIQTRL